jgi:hypothetical protein
MCKSIPKRGFLRLYYDLFTKLTKPCISRWSDGMGNPKKNSLPICQLSRIQKLVNQVNFSNRGEDQVGFWMDTLCVPVGDEYREVRKSCIRRMGHIYESAAAVLMLDSWMQGIAYVAPMEDRCVRLYQSNWQYRLWTYQEGFLARELHFQFSDRSQNMRDLQSEVHSPKETSETKKAYVSFPFKALGKVIVHFTLVKGAVQQILKGEASPSKRWTIFLPFADALGHRMTSRKSDETLCISTILGTDPSPYLEIDKGTVDEIADRRMELFLQTIGTFRAGFIFNRRPRLQKDGFRWAPRSMLSIHQPTLGILDSAGQGKLNKIGTSFGLTVKFPGFRFKLGPIAEHLSTMPEKCFAITTEFNEKQKIHCHVELEPNNLMWDSDLVYSVVMAMKLDKKSEEEKSPAIIGKVVFLPISDGLPPVEALRFECNATVYKRREKAPHICVTSQLLPTSTPWIVI